MSEKLIVSWEEYNKTVEKLAIMIHDSGYKPTLLVGIMRGGAPMIDLLSRVFKLKCAYLAVESYSGKGIEDKQGKLIFSREMSSTVENMGGNLLLCDDLSDTGVTLNRSEEWLKQYPPLKGKIKSKIERGFVIFLGVENNDDSSDVLWLTNKVMALRIFPDVNGVMNQSIIDIQGEVLVISQFTLHAKTKKGSRPSYIRAARPEQAIPMYEEFISSLSAVIGEKVCSGQFGAEMQVSLVNDGPVTILIDTKNKE